MPHFIIECSKNITEQKPAKEIIREVQDTAESSGLFAKGDIKVRINSYEHYLVGGTDADFIHVFGNIMEGRSEAQKNELSRSIVSKLKSMFPDVPILSMNVRDFEKAGYCNKTMV